MQFIHSQVIYYIYVTREREYNCYKLFQLTRLQLW